MNPAWKKRLCGLHEAAEILGVSDTRVGQLAKQDPTFPEPIDGLKCGRIWGFDALLDYKDARDHVLAARAAAQEVQSVILERVLPVPEMVSGPPLVES